MNSRTGLLFQAAAIAGSGGGPVRGLGAVDKAPTQPYLCQRRVSGDSAHFAGVFAADPRTDELPLIWRTSPRLGLAP